MFTSKNNAINGLHLVDTGATVEGVYELDAPEDGTIVAVKITDMLGEGVLETKVA